MVVVATVTATVSITRATLIAFNERGGAGVVLPQREATAPSTATATAGPPWLTGSPPASPRSSPTATLTPTPVPSPKPGVPSRKPTVPSQAPKPPAPSPPRDQARLPCEGTADPQSNDYWAQDDLALRVPTQLRALTATIRVARTERVKATGAWLSLPNGDFQSSIDTTRDAVVYRWTLLPGRVVQPGSYTLAAQYDRTAAHDPRKDTFAVQATTQAGQPMTCGGHF